MSPNAKGPHQSTERSQVSRSRPVEQRDGNSPGDRRAGPRWQMPNGCPVGQSREDTRLCLGQQPLQLGRLDSLVFDELAATI